MEKFHYKLHWKYRGIKIPIGVKTIISFFLVLIIPITGLYLALIETLKEHFTKEYIQQAAKQIKSVYEIFETEVSKPLNIANFIIQNDVFKSYLKSDKEKLANELATISKSVNGVNITFVYNISENNIITSNGKNFDFYKLFNSLYKELLNKKTTIKSYEIINFDKSIFDESQLYLLENSGFDELLVYFMSIPFKHKNTEYILGSFTVLNKNKWLMDKLYNVFTYNTALFSALSYKDKIIATNSSPKNIFFINLTLPDEMLDKLKEKSLISGIYTIDNEPIVAATIPLKSISGDIVGGLSIANNLVPLKVIINKFTGLTTLITFLFSVLIIIIGGIVYNDTKRPIWGLKKAMQVVANNNFDVYLDYKTYDDFEDIAKYFNNMVQSLRDYTTILNRFNNLNQVITTTLEVEEILNITMSKIMEYTSSQLAVVYMYDKYKNILYPYNSKNVRLSSLQNVKMGEGLVGEVAKTKTYFCITDITPENFILDSGIGNVKPKEIAAFPIALKDELIGVMVVGSMIKHKKEELDLVNNLLVQVAIVLDNCLIHKKVSELSIKDELTGTYNRRYLIQALETEFSKCKRNKIPLSIGIYDLDNFKKINDNYGHPTGDLVLKSFAEIILKNKRDYDILGRYGGEEFMIILPGADNLELKQILERHRKLIEESLYKILGFKVTCSIGGVTISNYENIDVNQLIKIADDNLYKAKSTGKNKVVI